MKLSPITKAILISVGIAALFAAIVLFFICLFQEVIVILKAASL